MGLRPEGAGNILGVGGGGKGKGRGRGKGGNVSNWIEKARMM